MARERGGEEEGMDSWLADHLDGMQLQQDEYNESEEGQYWAMVGEALGDEDIEVNPPAPRAGEDKT